MKSGIACDIMVGDGLDERLDLGINVYGGY
jgi:hypothetical protein